MILKDLPVFSLNQVSAYGFSTLDYKKYPNYYNYNKHHSPMLPCGLFLEPRLQAPDKLAERHSTLLQSSSPATGQPVNTFTGWPKQKRTRHTPCPKDNSRQTPFDLHQDRQPGPTHKHTLWKPSNQQKAEEHSL
ncbi:hypothetical protein J4Q44_G00004210 [Coregonus suidteri]|uniref:Uncharacterized protein n=1 Tax=Coregonus suidteri TaxID=861788 RepID=A0AAN8R8V1_9TELE